MWKGDVRERVLWLALVAGVAGLVAAMAGCGGHAVTQQGAGCAYPWNSAGYQDVHVAGDVWWDPYPQGGAARFTVLTITVCGVQPYCFEEIWQVLGEWHASGRYSDSDVGCYDAAPPGMDGSEGQFSPVHDGVSFGGGTLTFEAWDWVNSRGHVYRSTDGLSWSDQVL